MADKFQAAAAANTLKPFIGRSQLACLRECCKGEEQEFFFQKLVDLETIVTTMPVTYEQDGKGDEAMVFLHYFMGGMDWWIIERDIDNDGLGQQQAFGLTDLGYGAELGYISIDELIANGVELDLHWTPKPLKDVKAGRSA